MISHSSFIPSDTTLQYLQRTLRLVLYLYCVMLAFQLPLILLETPVSLLKLTIWLAYLVSLSLLVNQRRNLARTNVKAGLFVLYFSYLCIAAWLWPDVSNTHYFLLVSLVIAGFVFTQQERNTQYTVVATAIFTYTVISTSQYLHKPGNQLVQYCNDLTLGAICVVIYIAFQRMALLRWKKLKFAHSQSVSVLSKLLPCEPEKPERFWPLGVTRKYPCVTVLFADLAGYTRINRESGDDKTLTFMKALFQRLDLRASHYGLEKIKTNGDQYIAISTLTSTNHQQNCKAVLNFAISIHKLINRLARRSDMPFQLRIGIATGPVHAGMLGEQRPQFDVWGQTVNLAAFLEQTCSHSGIRYCSRTARLLGIETQDTFRSLSSKKHPDVTSCHEVIL